MTRTAAGDGLQLDVTFEQSLCNRSVQDFISAVGNIDYPWGIARAALDVDQLAELLVRLLVKGVGTGKSQPCNLPRPSPRATRR